MEYTENAKYIREKRKRERLKRAVMRIKIPIKTLKKEIKQELSNIDKANKKIDLFINKDIDNEKQL